MVQLPLCIPPLRKQYMVPSCLGYLPCSSHLPSQLLDLYIQKRGTERMAKQARCTSWATWFSEWDPLTPLASTMRAAALSMSRIEFVPRLNPVPSVMVANTANNSTWLCAWLWPTICCKSALRQCYDVAQPGFLRLPQAPA